MGNNNKNTGTCGPDITDWFVEEVNIHMALFQRYTAGALFKLVIFARYAKRLAYKYLRFRSPQCPCQNCLDTVTLCGVCVHVSDIGNIMFGAMGKIWLGTEPLIIACGAAAARRSSTGGIDSVADMASSVAGLQLGRSILRQGISNINRQILCSAITVTDQPFVNRLKEYFTGNALDWLNSIGSNPLRTIAVNRCTPCTQSLSLQAPHSNFAWIQEPRDLSRAIQQWWQTYQGMNNNGIDNSGIPWNE